MKKEVAILLTCTLLIAGCGETEIIEVVDRAPGKKSPAKAEPKQDAKKSQSKEQPQEPTKTSPPDAITTAKLQLQQIAVALNRYQIDMRTYPDASLGLAALRKAPEEISDGSKWLGPYLEEDLPLDPWGKRYFYDRGFDENDQPFFTIWSTGPNKLDDGGGDDVSERSNGKWLDLSANKESAAKMHLQALANALELYRMDLGTYPAKEIGLQTLKNTHSTAVTDTWAGPYLRKNLPQDPFGTDYHYDVKLDENDKETFSLWSVGADGQNGTADDIIQKTIPGYAETLAAALTKGDSQELLALGVTPNYLARQRLLGVLKQLQEFRKALDLYELDMKSYPNTTAGLGALLKQPEGVEDPEWKGPYLKEPLPLDPWGNKYFYELKADANQGKAFRIWSIGPNGQNEVGNGGDDIVVRSDGRWLTFVTTDKKSVAQIHLQALATGLELYRIDLGTYPAKEMGLHALKESPQTLSQKWAGPYLHKKLPLDPWARDYFYDVKLDENDKETFSVWSLGADGKNGTADDIIQKPIPGYAETLAAALTKGDSKELLGLGVTGSYLIRKSPAKAQDGESVDLSYNELTVETLTGLKEVKDLQALKLNTTQLSDDDLAHIKELATLESLGLANTQVTDAGLAHLKELKALKTLDLSYTQVTDAGLPHLQGLTNLQILDLPLTKITDTGLEQLKEMTSLVLIDIRLTKVTDAGLAHLAGMENLKSLNLAANQITDAGLAHLKGLAGLTALDLGYTQVTDAGLAHLKELTNLQTLNLKRTQVTDEAVAQLQESLKGCQITTSKTVAAAAEAASEAATETDKTEKAEPEKTTETKEQPANSPASTAGLSRVAKYALSQIKKYDTNSDGTLDKDEWSKNKFIEDSFDANGDGKITVEELTKGFGG